MKHGGALAVAAPILALALVVALFGGFATAATGPRAEIERLVSEHDVFVASKTYCPYCRRAKALLRQMNTGPHVVELDERDDGKAWQAALFEITGQRTVPNIFIGGQHVGGSDDLFRLRDSGKLAEMLAKAGGQE